MEGPIPQSFVLYLRTLPDMVLGQQLNREHAHPGGGEGSAHPRCLLGVCLRPEAGRIHTESIFLMPSISFMRMDYAAGVIYTNGDDKF